MKLRYCFVSNSSSSSFILSLDLITDEQKNLILNHICAAKQMMDTDPESFQFDYLDYPWEITIHGNKLHGYTLMDNFDMRTFLEKIEINSSIIEWNY